MSWYKKYNKNFKFIILIKDLIKSSFALLAIVAISIFSVLYFSVLSVKADTQQNFQINFFTKKMFFGLKNQQVVGLQQLLNRDQDTIVAKAGPGSIGHETSFFGNATKQAVIKFQYKYKFEVLLPAKLTNATGVVGPYTLAKLNSLAQNTNITNSRNVSGNSILSSNTGQGTITHDAYGNVTSIVKEDKNNVSNIIQNSTTTSQSDQSQQLVNQSKELKVFNTTPYQILPGSTITVYGTGFSQNNTLYIGDNTTIQNISTFDGNSLSAVIPASLSSGRYEIWITNENGSSRRSSFPVYIVITNNPNPLPHIDSISPETVTSLDQQVTISGSGFTSNNTIYSPFGFISGISSADTKTMKFSLSQFPQIAKINTIKSTAALSPVKTVGVYVFIGLINDNGSVDTASKGHVIVAN